MVIYIVNGVLFIVLLYFIGVLYRKAYPPVSNIDVIQHKLQITQKKINEVNEMLNKQKGVTSDNERRYKEALENLNSNSNILPFKPNNKGPGSK